MVAMPGRQIPVELVNASIRSNRVPRNESGATLLHKDTQAGSGYAGSQPSTRPRTYEAPAGDWRTLTVLNQTRGYAVFRSGWVMTPCARRAELVRAAISEGGASCGSC